jgi:hypothetical protein
MISIQNIEGKFVFLVRFAFAEDTLTVLHCDVLVSFRKIVPVNTQFNA